MIWQTKRTEKRKEGSELKGGKARESELRIHHDVCESECGMVSSRL